MNHHAQRRIAFVAAQHDYAWGGCEDLWAGAAISLAKQGHAVFANVPPKGRWPEELCAVARSGVRVTERHVSFLDRVVARINACRRASGRRSVSPSFARWVRSVRPDIVCVSHGGYADGRRWMEQLHTMQIPYCSVVQAIATHMWPTDAEAKDLRKLYSAARAVYCVSRANLKMLEDQLALQLPNASTVWNPFNVPRADPPPWPETCNVWRLACVGRLDPGAKGQDILFGVLSRPEWRERPVRLSLFGGGRSPESVRSLARMYGVADRIDFHGHVSDVAEIWRSHHALALPSRFEGLPLALVESMLMARPAIVTDVAGNAEVVVDGETGFVAAAPHVAILANTMERAWAERHRWKSMGLAARRRALDLLPENPCESFAAALLRLCTS